MNCQACYDKLIKKAMTCFYQFFQELSFVVNTLTATTKELPMDFLELCNAVANVIQPALRKALDDVLAGRATPVEAAQTAATTVNGNKK